MFLKAFHFMYAYSNPQLGLTPLMPPHGTEDDKYYANGGTIGPEPTVAAAMDGLPPAIGTSLAVLRKATVEAADRRRKALNAKRPKKRKTKAAPTGKGASATKIPPRAPSLSADVPPPATPTGTVRPSFKPPTKVPSASGSISSDGPSRRSAPSPKQGVVSNAKIPVAAVAKTGSRTPLSANPQVSTVSSRRILSTGPPQRPSTQQASTKLGGTATPVFPTSPLPQPLPADILKQGKQKAGGDNVQSVTKAFSGTYAHATRKGSMLPSSQKDGAKESIGTDALCESEDKRQPDPLEENNDEFSDNNEEMEEEEEEDEEDGGEGDEADDDEEEDEFLSEKDDAIPAQSAHSVHSNVEEKVFPPSNTSATSKKVVDHKKTSRPLSYPPSLDILGFCRQAYTEGPVLL